MSDTIFNIRFGKRHFQIHRNSPWISFRYNDYWDSNPMPKWIEVYQWFGVYCK